MRGYMKECCTHIPTGHSEILNITKKIQEVNEDIIKLGNMPNGPCIALWTPHVGHEIGSLVQSEHVAPALQVSYTNSGHNPLRPEL